MPPLEFSHAQPVDQAAVQHLSPATPDCSFAREVQTQVSASMAQPMPGAESMMAAAPGMPVVPGAEQAISPLLQMIMRLPGHIGLASSFFEALGNFLLPQTDMLSIFDPSHFGLHIDLSAALPADHSAIDFSLLPHDAPILDHLGNSHLSAHSIDLASDKLNISLGGHSHFVADGGSNSLSMGSQFNVSGQAAFAKPQFEGAGGLVSGPSLSENFSPNSMSPNNRLFSDGASISAASKNMMIAGGGPTVNGGAALNAPSLTQGASVSSLNSAGGSTVAASGTGSGMVDNVSASPSTANNVSYNVFEKLTGNKDLLAANSVSDSYHSTIGTIQPDAVPDASAHTGSSHASATTSSDNPGGLKAKPMSLDGSKVDLKADHANHGHIDHNKTDHADHTASSEHKVDHKPEHAPEHTSNHSADSKVSDATAAHKTVDQVSHQTNAVAKPIAHSAAPAHHSTHVQAADVTASDSALTESKHVAPVEAKHIVSVEGKHIASIEPKHVAPVEAKHVTAAAQHVATQVVHAANPANHIAGASGNAAPAPVAHEHIMRTQNIDAAPGQNEAAQSAASTDAQQQFGEPVKSTAGGDATANTGDATQTHDASGQTLEQQQAPATAKAYTIRSGDCLWNIAKDQLGDATKWSDIYKMNSDVLGANPSLIHPGASIQLPGAEGAATGNISHYTVKAGDNLWDIAKNQMGDATKWGDLYKANQDVIGSNPGLIRPGQELTINTGAADPSGAQVSSAAPASTDPTLAQAQAPSAAGHASAPQQAGGDLGRVSQNSASIQTYGDGTSADMQTPTVQNSSEINFEAAPMSHNIQAPQAPSVTPVKVMPVEAQPDVIIQPAHAADLSTSGLSSEAANVANGVTQSQKGGMVDTSVGSDLMSFINKRR
jgi:nucleoid-associated protein YgaU